MTDQSSTNLPSGLRHDGTGRSVPRPRNKREQQCINPPKDEGWISIPKSVLENGANRSLSINARRVLNSNHNRLQNGNLRVSARQFHEWGVTKNRLTPAISEFERQGVHWQNTWRKGSAS